MRRRRPDGGQSSTEFLVVFPLLVMLVFGVIQFALLYQARATLNYAALLAARAGAVHNGSATSMRVALASGLAPLFASEPTMSDYTGAVLKANLETAALSNLTKIDVLNPTAKALQDFARARLDGSGRELPNDTLNYRNPTPGTKSALSVQDANILHVRVSYCYRLIVPVVGRVMYAAVNALTPFDAAVSANGMSDPFGSSGTTVSLSCINPAFRGPRIVIRSEAMVRMQSPFYESNL
ncbi:pilus assembly protein TadG [Janthinobacterium sp. BJB412]|nr:pilus assembly protein TadG [Janthinobacterium sp. BJB412]